MTKRLFMIVLALPIMVGVLALLISKGMYFSMDEVEMRLMIEGSLASGSFRPMPYSPYMNVLYTGLLGLLYRLHPDAYWFDFANYFFLLASIVVICFALRTGEKRRDVLAALAGCVVAFVYFSFPQFTMTAGVLAIAGVLSGFRYCKAGRGRLGWLISSACCLLVSSLFRYKCCLGVGFFSGVCLLAFDWGLLRVAFKRIAFLLLVAFVPILSAKKIGASIVSSHPVWSTLTEFNTIRAGLTDYSDVWNTWPEGFEECLDVVNKGVGAAKFTREDYGLYICGAMVGNDSVFNLCNLREVSKNLRPYVHNKSADRLSFKIVNWSRLFVPLLLLVLCVAVMNGHVVFKRVMPFLFFVVIICLVRYYLKDPPERLWINFALAVFLSLVYSGLRHGSAPGMAIGSARLFAGAFALVAFIVLVSRVTIKQVELEYKPYGDLVRAKLPTDKLVFLSTDCARYLRAFNKNKLSNRSVVILGPYGWFPQYRAMIDKFGLSREHVWRDVCAKGSRVCFVQQDERPNCYLNATLRTIAAYVKKNYGMTIVAQKERLGENVGAIRLRALSPEEFEAKKRFEIDFCGARPSPSRTRKAQALIVAQNLLGQGSSLDEIAETAWAIASPIVDKDFAYAKVEEF